MCAHQLLSQVLLIVTTNPHLCTRRDWKNKEKGLYAESVELCRHETLLHKRRHGKRYRYERFIKRANRYLGDMTLMELRYVVGNKFFLQGNEINSERKLDERGEPERRRLLTQVDDEK